MNLPAHILDKEILDQLLKLPICSPPYIQRKYKVSFPKARDIHKKWLDKQPKALSFDERYELYRKNPTAAKSPPKVRKATFYIKGQRCHTWEEAQILLGQTQ